MGIIISIRGDFFETVKGIKEREKNKSTKTSNGFKYHPGVY